MQVSARTMTGRSAKPLSFAEAVLTKHSAAVRSDRGVGIGQPLGLSGGAAAGLPAPPLTRLGADMTLALKPGVELEAAQVLGGGEEAGDRAACRP